MATTLIILSTLQKLENEYNYYTIYTAKIFFRRSFFLYSLCHYMRAWIHILDAPSCYERAAALCGQRESPHYKAQDWSEL